MKNGLFVAWFSGFGDFTCFVGCFFFFFDRISIEHTKCPLKKFCIKRVCYIGRFGLSEALLREVCFIERFVDI